MPHRRAAGIPCGPARRRGCSAKAEPLAGGVTAPGSSTPLLPGRFHALRARWPNLCGRRPVSRASPPRWRWRVWKEEGTEALRRPGAVRDAIFAANRAEPSRFRLRPGFSMSLFPLASGTLRSRDFGLTTARWEGSVAVSGLDLSPDGWPCRVPRCRRAGIEAGTTPAAEARGPASASVPILITLQFVCP